MASHGLVEVDSIDITVIVDNEVDPISPSNNPAVQYAGLLQGVPLDVLDPNDPRGGAQAELRMSSICCGAHGLSLLIASPICSLLRNAMVTAADHCRSITTTTDSKPG